MEETTKTETRLETLSLLIERSGRGDTVTVIAKLGDEELHRDTGCVQPVHTANVCTG